jgi:hypothetical protein
MENLSLSFLLHRLGNNPNYTLSAYLLRNAGQWLSDQLRTFSISSVMISLSGYPGLKTGWLT